MVVLGHPVRLYEGLAAIARKESRINRSLLRFHLDTRSNRSNGLARAYTRHSLWSSDWLRRHVPAAPHVECAGSSSRFGRWGGPGTQVVGECAFSKTSLVTLGRRRASDGSPALPGGAGGHVCSLRPFRSPFGDPHTGKLTSFELAGHPIRKRWALRATESTRDLEGGEGLPRVWVRSPRSADPARSDTLVLLSTQLNVSSAAEQHRAPVRQRFSMR